MKNKALISHCHVWEGHTLPKHGQDHSWTAFGCWARMIAFMCPTIRSEHKPWRTLMKAVDCLNAEEWTEVFPGQQADKHYSHDWWINFWCFVQTLVLKFRGFFFIFFTCFSRFCSVFVSLELDRTFSEVFLPHLPYLPGSSIQWSHKEDSREICRLSRESRAPRA